MRKCDSEKERSVRKWDGETVRGMGVGEREGARERGSKGAREQEIGGTNNTCYDSLSEEKVEV